MMKDVYKVNDAAYEASDFYSVFTAWIGELTLGSFYNDSELLKIYSLSRRLTLL